MFTENLQKISKYLSRGQLMAILSACNGEESSVFAEWIESLCKIIDNMPVTYEQDGKGRAAIAYLHYFTNSADFYITEKDMDGDIYQATGYASINGNPLELGYISIKELVDNGVELDLHWSPVPIAQVFETA